jgi:amino acid adenylation domain-containing protein
VDTRPDLESAQAHIRQRQVPAFAMEHPPLWRAGLVYVDHSAHPLFWLTLHHSVSDGVSVDVLSTELAALLRGEVLPPVGGNFDHSAGHEENYLAGPGSIEDSQYWRKALSELGDGCSDTPQPFDEWPLDAPRPLARARGQAEGSHVLHLRLNASTAAGLGAFAKRNGATLHALMLTILAHEVRRRTGRREFVIGTAASTRDSASEAGTVGYYVNMLPLPCRVHGESVEQVLGLLQNALAEALQHARYPFARISGDFRQDHPARMHPARHPVFDLAVTESPAGAIETDRGFWFSSLDSTRDAYQLSANAPAHDMVLVHVGQPDGSLILRWFVNAAIYEKETAQAWMDALAGWAHLLADGDRVPNSALPALLPAEEKLLAQWERGATLPYHAPSVAAQFDHWAMTQPERPALITDHGEQSYAALNARSSALAHALIAEGVEPQSVVGVLTDRSIALPETVLAIWKTGACYLPLLADLPAERMAFIARDAGIRALVVLDGLMPPPALLETGCRIFRPENIPDTFCSSHRHTPSSVRNIRELDLAAIIYTSGSTGVPKGVMLHHRGLNNLGVGAAAALDLGSGDRVLQMASPAFDAWLSDLIMAWTAGAAAVPVLRQETEDIAVMRDKLTRQGVTVATMSPSYLRLLEQADFPGLRVLTTVGESPNRADALYYAARLRYFNGYGPTENSVATSFGQVAAQAGRLTAGRPLANTSVRILDSHRRPVPPGAVGYIWTAGAGVALGYLNRPELTAASFIDTPEGPMYATGDLGRWTHAGELEILGRSDGQLKLHGQRVELGEIEHRLEVHPSVKQGVAIAESRTDGTQILRAFVCLHPGVMGPTQAEWHDHLSEKLPSYMLPSGVIPVPAIPMNTSGKVDRAALLAIASEQVPVGDIARTEPGEGLERSIARVWAKHLECRFVGREDNFFDLGGNSLRAISVVSELRRTLHCTVNDLYEHPRLAGFAAACRQRPEHLRTLIQSTARDWRDYQRELPAYEAEREAALTAARREYEQRNQAYLGTGAAARRDYSDVLLTGATGYVGVYLLRELLADADRQVSVLVRAPADSAARQRLGEVLCYYFGADAGRSLLDDPRLRVLAGDLRCDDLGLSPGSRARLADHVRAVFHCAANVKHFGRYQEFHSDNVAATERLLKLAAHRPGDPADFHFVSTSPPAGRRLKKGSTCSPSTMG